MQAATSDARRGIRLALAGFVLFSIGDAVVKSMAGQWSAPAITTLRYFFGVSGLGIVVALRHGRAGFVMPRPWLQLWRGSAVAFATVCFFMSVHRMPLADATAIMFLAPVLTASLSPLILREPASRATWVAVALGFSGVLIVLRPNLLALGPAALLPLGSAFGMAFLVMGNRRAAGLAPAFTMQFLVALFALPLLIAATVLGHLSGAPGFAVTWPPAAVVAKCAAVALTASTGHWLIFRATERASASLIAPMTYVQIVGAVALGWWAFGDPPDLATVAGAALVIGAGLWLYLAQRASGPSVIA